MIVVNITEKVMITVIIVDMGIYSLVSIMKGGKEDMTEKRFNLVGSYLYDGDECISHFDDPKHRDEIVELLNDFYNENEQLKKGISLFKGEDAGHYQRWVNQIKKYLDESNPDFEYDEDFIIKIALSYTLQSLRNGESLKRFQWEYKELEE